MKKIKLSYTFIILMIISLAFMGCEVKKVPTVGSVAHQFNSKSLDGEMVDVGSDNEKLMLLRFWNLGCPICIKEMPEIDMLYRKYSEVLEIVAINSDDSRDMIEEFIKDRNIAYKIVQDSSMDLKRAYGVIAVPISFFVDRDGIIRDVIVGELDINGLERKIVALKK